MIASALFGLSAMTVSSAWELCPADSASCAGRDSCVTKIPGVGTVCGDSCSAEQLAVCQGSICLNLDRPIGLQCMPYPPASRSSWGKPKMDLQRGGRPPPRPDDNRDGDKHGDDDEDDRGSQKESRSQKECAGPARMSLPVPDGAVITVPSQMGVYCREGTLCRPTIGVHEYFLEFDGPGRYEVEYQLPPSSYRSSWPEGFDVTETTTSNDDRTVHTVVYEVHSVATTSKTRPQCTTGAGISCSCSERPKVFWCGEAQYYNYNGQILNCEEYFAETTGYEKCDAIYAQQDARAAGQEAPEPTAICVGNGPIDLTEYTCVPEGTPVGDEIIRKGSAAPSVPAFGGQATPDCCFKEKTQVFHTEATVEYQMSFTCGEPGPKTGRVTAWSGDAVLPLPGLNQQILLDVENPASDTYYFTATASTTVVRYAVSTCNCDITTVLVRKAATY